MQRWLFALLLAAAFPCANAQTPRIGVLLFTGTPGFREAFSEGLRDSGYQDGKNVRIDWRLADGRDDRADAIARELVDLKVDVIVASLSQAVRAAQKATRTIPIVMAPAGDPVAQGFVASLARPGGNISGVTGGDLSGKRLELLQEFVPRLRSVSLLVNSADPSFGKVMTEGTIAAARGAGVQVQSVWARAGQFETAFAEIAKSRPGAVIVQPSLIGPDESARQVAALALRHRLPSMSQAATFADAGGLAAYGQSWRDQYRQSGRFVARILRGETPATMPVEQGTTYELVINLKTAKALGLKVPPSILARATRVVE